MILKLRSGIDKAGIAHVLKRIKRLKCKAHFSKGTDTVIIGVIGPQAIHHRAHFETLDEVDAVVPISKPYKLVSREFHPADSIIAAGGVRFGGSRIVVIAGPCSIEKKEYLSAVAVAVKRSGARVLRGGAFKPRSSPYAFQGHGKKALGWLKTVGRTAGMPVVTEVLDPRDVALVGRNADMFQIGARNSQNYPLLKEVGRSKKPVLLKRGMAMTVEELLLAAEYVAAQGNSNILLCERGIRTYENSTRFTLDLNAVPILKRLSHLPVIVDPSHGAGVREIIPAMTRAAAAAGADGLIIEVHRQPAAALSDGFQALLPAQFETLMRSLAPLARAIGRDI